jgi:hypothetical protein
MPIGGSPPVRRIARPRSDEKRATSLRAVIASSFFSVSLAMTVLLGGHAAVAPLLRTVVAARETKSTGDILYTMPDGVFCRHMSFDNATAEVVEGAIEHCPTEIVRDRARTSRGFAWGER